MQEEILVGICYHDEYQEGPVAHVL